MRAHERTADPFCSGGALQQVRANRCVPTSTSFRCAIHKRGETVRGPCCEPPIAARLIRVQSPGGECSYVSISVLPTGHCFWGDYERRYRDRANRRIRRPGFAETLDDGTS